MPIVSINAQSPADPEQIGKMIRAVQEAGARALECDKSNVWVGFHAVQARYFLHTHPVVFIRASAGRPHEARERFVRAVADSVAHGAGASPEEVWIHYQEMNPQDVWYRGSWTS